ncbi:MAG TPA: hypothetical protein VL354_06190 [Spirochaetia bacterium]|nr:hypothetical protein [Spirochaetia bacterium]
MPWEITHLRTINVLLIRVSGRVTLSSWRRQLKESIELARAHSCARYLVDYRDSTMQMSFVDLFDQPKFYAEAGLPYSARVALVFREAYPEADFVELVTQNRGYQVKVFASPEPAISWLTR